MKKKLISVLCVLTMIISMLPMGMTASAKATYDIEQKAELICSLGIIDDTQSRKITLKSYLKMMSKMYQDGDVDPIDFGVMMKMINGDETPSANISVADAIKYAVITLGYRVVAEKNGGTADAYAKIAQDTEISDGVSPTSEADITFEEAMTIIFNMLDATPMIQKFVAGDDAIFEVLDGETLLSHRMKVNKLEGIVSATPTTSIYKAEGCADNSIEIDMEKYAVLDGKDFSSFLGKDVEFYVKEDKNGDDVVVYMTGDKNYEEVIDAEFVLGANIKDGYIEYVNENYSKKKFKISYPPKVIYNDRFYSDYTDADFKPEIGQLRLVDNDKDNKFDVIFIDSYQEMLVSSRSLSDKTIYNKNSYDGALVSITLDGVLDRKYKIYKGDKEISFGEISSGNILLVKESKDNLFVTILVCEESAEGRLSSFDEAEEEMVVDGKTYDVTKGLIRILKAKAKTLAEANGEQVTDEDKLSFYEIGADYRILFDAFGRVAYMEKKQDMSYYLYFKSYPDEYDSEKVSIVYMNMNNEWNTAVTAKKVEWEDSRITGEILLQNLEGKKPQLVKMEFNAKGEVSKMELAVDTDLYREDKFTRTTPISGYYYSAQRTIDYNFYANPGAVVLKMPVGDEISDKTLYKFAPVDSNFYNDKQVNCRAFDIDEYNFSSIFSIELSSSGLSSSLSSDYFLVTKKNTIIYNDEPAIELLGLMGRFSNFSYIVKDTELAKDIQKGDLIRYHVSEQGYIDYLTKEYSMEGPFSTKWNLPNGSARLIAGTVQLIDLEKGIMKIDCGGSRTLMIVGTNSVIFYEKGTGDVRIGGISELIPGSQIIINGNWHKLAALYCIE